MAPGHCPRCEQPTATGIACPGCGLDIPLLEAAAALARESRVAAEALVVNLQRLNDAASTLESLSRERLRSPAEEPSKAIDEKEPGSSERASTKELSGSAEPAGTEERPAQSPEDPGSDSAPEHEQHEPESPSPGSVQEVAGPAGSTPPGDEPSAAPVPTSGEAPPEQAQPSDPVAAAAPGPSPPEVAPPEGHLTELALGQYWLLAAGVVLTVLGIGFFLKYAFDTRIIRPVFQVGIAYGAGFALLGVGRFFRRRGLGGFGQFLGGGGLAVLYFCGYSAFQIYGLVSQEAALALMVAVTVLVGSLALVHRYQPLAVLGLIGGFLTPVVLHTGEDHQVALMTYMVVLNAGVLGLAFVRQWRVLNALAFVFTWLLFLSWFGAHYSDSKFWTTTIFQTVFFLIYVLVPFAYHSLRPREERLRGLFITVPNTVLALIFSLVTVSQHFDSVRPAGAFTLGCAVLFMVLAWRLSREAGRLAPVVTAFLAKGLLLLAITVPVVVDTEYITLGLLLESIVFLRLSLWIRNGYLQRGAFVLLCLATTKLLLFDSGSVYELTLSEGVGARSLTSVRSFTYEDGFASLLPTRWLTSAVLLGGWYLASRWVARVEDLEDAKQRAFEVWGGFICLAWIILSVETAAWFGQYVFEARPAAISVLWSVFAAGLLALGFFRRQGTLRHVAFGLFLVTGAKVVLHDMSDASTPFRIVSFIALGGMLIGASYLYHRFVPRLLGEPGEAAEEDPGGPELSEEQGGTEEDPAT